MNNEEFEKLMKDVERLGPGQFMELCKAMGGIARIHARTDEVVHYDGWSQAASHLESASDCVG